MNASVIVGDCIEAMRAMPENSIDAIVTDPPYGLGFMGKAWDALPPGKPWANECLRVLKPGGHLVAFGGTRTVHRLTCAIEDAGFEIRDMGVWVYWQGFPKSLDVSKAIDAAAGAEREVVGYDASRARPNRLYEGGALGNIGGKGKVSDRTDNGATITAPATEEARTWQGFGTALKPAHEPWVLARKPLSGTVAANVLEWGTGALNIDGCRFAPGDPAWPGPDDGNLTHTSARPASPNATSYELPVRDAYQTEGQRLGRWPANLYACPKASRSERERGCEGLAGLSRAEAVDRQPGSKGASNPRAGAGRERTYKPGAEFHSGPGSPRRGCKEDYVYTPQPIRNHHPTVKPLALMRWLVRLVGGQPNSSNTILDPFAGSGTTLAAATLEGFNSIGIELSPDYAAIAKARIEWAKGERFHETRQADLFSPQPWQEPTP